MYIFQGACGILVGHPLDTIKTCQQASNIKIGRSMYEIIVHNNGVGIKVQYQTEISEKKYFFILATRFL